MSEEPKPKRRRKSAAAAEKPQSEVAGESPAPALSGAEVAPDADETKKITGPNVAANREEIDEALAKLKGFTVLSVSKSRSSDEVAIREDKFIGTTLDGKYQILTSLGRGGMSTVYKAKNTLTQRMVAVKIMHSHLLHDPSNAKRFEQEAKAASRLTHPNTIQIYDMGSTPDDHPYLIMEYLRGVSLGGELKEQGRINAGRAVHIFVQAAAALEDAHQNRIVHRDLKPSNIMLVNTLDDPDFVKIVDFGIAKILPQGDSQALRLTGTGEIFGTPLYMSPEQCQGRSLDARSDIYSFGCVMFEALMGDPPFQGASVMETMMLQLSERPPRLTEVQGNSVLIEQLEKIIFKCMEKDPQQRYQSMDEVRHALELAQGLSAPGLNPIARMQLLGRDAVRRAIRFFKSGPRALGLAAGVVLTMGGVMLLLSLPCPLIDPQPEQRQMEFTKPNFVDPVLTESLSGRYEKSWNTWQVELAHHLEEKMVPYMSIRKKSDDLYSSGEYVKAVDSYKETLAEVDKLAPFEKQIKPMVPIFDSCGLIQQFESPLGIFRMLPYVNMAECYLSLGQNNEAREFAELGCNLTEKCKERIYPIHCRALAIKAEALYRLGETEASREVFRQALSEWKDGSVTEHGKHGYAQPEQILLCLNLIAGSYFRDGDLPRAAELYDKLLTLWRELDKAASTKATRYNIAVTCDKLGLVKVAQSAVAKTRGDHKNEVVNEGAAVGAFMSATRGFNTMHDNKSAAKALFNFSDVEWQRGWYLSSLANRFVARAKWFGLWH